MLYVVRIDKANDTFIFVMQLFIWQQKYKINFEILYSVFFLLLRIMRWSSPILIKKQTVIKIKMSLCWSKNRKESYLNVIWLQRVTSNHDAQKVHNIRFTYNFHVIQNDAASKDIPDYYTLKKCMTLLHICESIFTNCVPNVVTILSPQYGLGQYWACYICVHNTYKSYVGLIFVD